MATPLLPVLPKHAFRRRYARVLRPQFRACRPQAPRFSRRSTPDPFRHAGLIALCLSGMALVSALLTFSIVRDMKALSRPEPLIAAPR